MTDTSTTDNNKAYLFMGHDSGIDVPNDAVSIRFHSSIKVVSGYMFQFYKQLKEVELNEGLLWLGAYAFVGCISLERITLPSTITKMGIGDHCFMNCINLRSVVFTEGNRMSRIEKNTFCNCSSLESITLPSTITTIENNAFMSCRSLECITIPSSVTEIGHHSFYNCKNLRKVVLNEGIQKIEQKAFLHCNSLESITLPSTLTAVAMAVFCGCSNLREVVLNEGIQKIGCYAFEGCTSLETITFPSTVTEIKERAFTECSSLREIILLNEQIQKIGHEAFGTAPERGASIRGIPCRFPNISTRLENITRAGQTEVISKIDVICGPAERRGRVERRNNELFVTLHTLLYYWEDTTKQTMCQIVKLIAYYELKEAATLFELAMWKTKMEQEGDHPINRAACRIDVPGPIKDAILGYLIP